MDESTTTTTVDESTTTTTQAPEQSTTTTTTEAVTSTTTEAPTTTESTTQPVSDVRADVAKAERDVKSAEDELRDAVLDNEVKSPANDQTLNDVTQTAEERAAIARSDAMTNHAAEHGVSAEEVSTTEEQV